MAVWEDPPPSPEDSFESAHYLVAHAASELDDLDRLVQEYIDSEPGTVVEEVNRKTGMLEVKIVTKQLPYRARGTASNIVKNLRDALDQVVHGASFLISGRNSRHTHFPFGGSPEDFDKAVGLNTCKDIPADLYPILRSFQPWPSDDAYIGGDNMLRMLGRISGPHKHRVTLTVGTLNRDLSLGEGFIEFGEGGAIFPPSKNGDAVLYALGRGGKAKIETRASFMVVFSHPKLRDITALDFLHYLVATVTKIVQDVHSEAVVIAKG